MNDKAKHKGVESMNENVIYLKPKHSGVDRFQVFLGEVDQEGQVVEREQVGLSFLKEGSKAFRLKLWMMSNEVYFLVLDKASNTRYTIYSVEDYLTREKEARSFWNKIGEANLIGNYLKMSIPLFGQELFMSLYPDSLQAKSPLRSA